MLHLEASSLVGSKPGISRHLPVVRTTGLAICFLACVSSYSQCSAQPPNVSDWTKLNDAWKANQSKAESIRIEFSLIQVNATRQTPDRSAVLEPPFAQLPARLAQKSVRYECLFIAKGPKYRFVKTGHFWNSKKRRYEKGQQVYTWNSDDGSELIVTASGPQYAVLYSETPTIPSTCLLYTSPSPRDRTRSRMPSSA